MLAAAVLTAGCSSFVTGMATPAGAAVASALRVGVEGFAAAPVSTPPPRSICEGSGNPVGLPEVDPALGAPTATAGYTAGEASLDVWAWQTGSPERAADIVTTAARAADDCEYDLIADYDTDGDGQIDSGSQTVASAGGYDRAGWTGVAIGVEQDGDPVTETRYVRMGDLVVLVRLDAGDGDPDAPAIVDGYLADVAAAL